MYAVSRVLQARPDRFLEATEMVASTGEMLRSRFDFNVRTSTEEFGLLGRFAFTSRWGSLSELMEMRGRLMQDADYIERMRTGGELFMPGVADHVFMSLDGSPMPEPAPLTGARFAVARQGHLREAAEFAGQIAADVAESVDTNVHAAMMRGGIAGTFAWITTFNSIDEWEQTFARFAADEASSKAIDYHGHLWMDGSTRDQLWRGLD